MHYTDGSHRWIAPEDIDQEEWNERMRWHLDRHLAEVGNEQRRGALDKIQKRYASRDSLFQEEPP